MAVEQLMGTVTFIHHDKGYATIAYTFHGRKKSVNGNISDEQQQLWKAAKIIKKTHSFQVGDEVSFVLTKSQKGDKLIADCIEFKYNNAMDNLLQKSELENRLVGYLKKVDNRYFVKETGSYIVFPVELSPWEKKPLDVHLNEPVFFKLNNPENRQKATAALYKSVYIPEYLAAQRYFHDKKVIDATIFKITPHGIFLNVVGDKVQAKIPLDKFTVADNVSNPVKIGDVIKVVINYLSPSKIVVIPVSS